MPGGIGLQRTAVAGAIATVIGLVVVALRPPTSLSPVAFLGTLALGAGLGVVAVAGFDFVATRVVATDGGPGGGEPDTRGPEVPETTVRDPDADAPDAIGTDASGPGTSAPDTSVPVTGGSGPVRSGGDAGNGGLAATEELLRGGSGGDRAPDGDARPGATGTSGSDPEFELDEDDEGFIWGGDAGRDER